MKSKIPASKGFFFFFVAQVSSFVCVILHPCPFFPVSLACEGVHFQKHAEGTKLQANVKKGAGEEVVAILYFPTPPTSFLLTPPPPSPSLCPFFCSPQRARLLGRLFNLSAWKMERKRLLRRFSRNSVLFSSVVGSASATQVQAFY